MKICPTCNKTYTDDEINFCLSDGTTLLKKREGKRRKHSRINEMFAVVLMALAVLVFLCLVTYSPSDWSLNTASSQRTQNWIGVAGAVVADVLFQAIGISAYIFPALVGLIAWRVFQAANLKPQISRIIGFFLFVISASGLTHLIGWHGGLVGAFVSAYTVYLVSNVGAAILLSAFLIASVLLLTNLTFLGFAGNIEMARQNFRIHYNEWRAKRRHGHSEEFAKARERSTKRREIREGKLVAVPPNIVVPEIMAAAAGAGATRVQVGTPQADSVPTFIPTEKPVSNEAADAIKDNGTPVEPTGELDSKEDLEAAPETKITRQNFERYVLPHPSFLHEASEKIQQNKAKLHAIAEELEQKAQEFSVTGKVINILPGPIVTTYEFKPDPGVKYSRVTNLVDDLCLALEAESIRIDRIPGKAFVGIEVPNAKRQTIHLREVIESKEFRDSKSLLTFALGKTIDGFNYITDLAKMPHLLIAGATGTGKSVGVNSLVISILYKAKPDEVKFIMVDPKRLELGLYADIPHLSVPIITDPKRAANALKWATTEMERRYRDLAGFGVRNIDGYNTEVKRRNSIDHTDENGEQWRVLPYIVIIIDELADLMMVSGKETEESITRLAQMARAVGIHLVLATQRPSVDVITGLIKANFPSRISFRVSTKVDSRTIIDANGSESLLGKGDMLYLASGSAHLLRVHGAYVDEKEVYRVVDHVKRQGRPEYDATITKTEEELDESIDHPGRRDPLFNDALRTVVHAKRASTSLLMRHLSIGYGRAAKILDAMVAEGYIGDMDGSTRARPILPKAYEDLQDIEEMLQ